MMNIKAFYDSHHRFPYNHEFHIIKEGTTVREKPVPLTEAELQKPIERFVQAAKLNQLDEMKLCLSLGINIDDYNAAGVTALCAAAQWNNVNCVEFLLDNGASVDLRSCSARSPLLYAAESGHLHMMSYLINRGSTNFTYNDQQLESYFISYTIRQAITRRDVASVVKDERVTDIILDFLGLSSSRIRPLERMTANIDPTILRKYEPNPYYMTVPFENRENFTNDGDNTMTDKTTNTSSSSSTTMMGNEVNNKSKKKQTTERGGYKQNDNDQDGGNGQDNDGNVQDGGQIGDNAADENIDQNIDQ